MWLAILSARCIREWLIWPLTPNIWRVSVVIAAIVDTGPLVALLDDSEAHHVWTKSSLSPLTLPLLTCEAVLTEALFLLSAEAKAPLQIRALLQSNALRVAVFGDADWSRILDLMTHYHDVPMSLADSCLVRLSELQPKAKVVTLDADFRIYRRNRNQEIPLLMPARQ